MATDFIWGVVPVLLACLIASWTAPRFAVADRADDRRKPRLVWLVPFGFILLTAGFKIYDPYNTLFFDGKWLPHAAHLAIRILFCIYFFLILFCVGQSGLILTRKTGLLLTLAPSEEIAICALLGSSVLRFAMFLIGFFSSYAWPALLTLATAALLIGTPRFVLLLRSSLTASMRYWNGETNSTEKIVVAAIIGALLSAVLAVSIGKFLYPNGTGDYFSHYLPYYKEVARTGSIWPNEVWYHFFISKGFGDVFFAVVLSDLLGPLAVSQAMFVLGLVIVYAMTKRAFDDRIAAFSTAAIVAAGFIWTFEQRIGLAYWAEFAKQHVITSVLFMGCVWTSWLQLHMKKLQTWGWTIVSISIYCGLVLARPQFFVLIAVFLSLMTVYAWVSQRGRCVAMYLAILLAGAGAVGAMLALNYSITGLAEVTPFRTFWRHADQAHFATWVSPFLMLLLDLGSSPDLGSIAMPNLSQFKLVSLLSAVFRIDRAAPVFALWAVPFLIVAASGLLLLRSGASRLPLPGGLRSSTAALTCMFVASVLVFFSVNQIGSIFRLYTFCIFPVVIFALLPFVVVRSAFREAGWARAVTGLALGAISIAAVPSAVKQIPPQQRSAYSSFAVGLSSMKDAYAGQNAVWEEGLAIVKVAGPDVAVWSSQITGQFCVAPGCNFETFFSYSMGPDWHVIMFDDPAHARAALERAGLNHFAIDTSKPFFDLLPYSPLFAPDHIRDHLALEWTNGTVYLLTWPGPGTRPLPPDFTAAYLKSMQAAMTFADFPGMYDDLRDVYVKWKADPHWPIALDLGRPRPRGWQ